MCTSIVGLILESCYSVCIQFNVNFRKLLLMVNFEASMSAFIGKIVGRSHIVAIYRDLM